MQARCYSLLLDPERPSDAGTFVGVLIALVVIAAVLLLT
jgi:hypothetical protein